MKHPSRLVFDASKKSLSVNWNVFAFTLERTFQSYYNARKAAMSNYLRQVSNFSNQAFAEVKKVPILKVLLAIFPYTAYLVMFSCNPQLRHITHLDAISMPHYIFLSRVERTLFFCYPHRVLSSLANPLFDAVAAVPYLVHFPLPFLFALYLAVSESRRDAFLPYLWCVGWVNFTAVIFQTTFPTAPPWFADSAVMDGHGEVIFEAPSEAGFSRMDKMLGTTLFHGLYSTSPLKFGAFPSLHVAVPMVIFLNHPWISKKFGAFHVVLIALSAVYITHHYLVDALGGVLLACIVRLSILKIWSPFKELQEPKTNSKTEAQDSSALTA